MSHGGMLHLDKITVRNFRCNACSQAQAKTKEGAVAAADPVEKGAGK
jgi:hypothetical protein